MSYVPVFAPDALLDWRELEIEFQELFLDELDYLASNPVADVSDLRHHVERIVVGVPHDLFIRVIYDHTRRAVTIIGVALDPPDEG